MTMIVKYEQGDGTVGVSTPTPELIAKMGGSELKAAEKARDLKITQGKPIIELADHTTLPPRTFRDQWRKNGTSIATDMPLAKVEHLDRVRVARDKKMDDNDAEIDRLNDIGGGGNIAAAAVLQGGKQAMRDLPNSGTFYDSVQGAADEAALDALWPSEVDARV